MSCPSSNTELIDQKSFWNSDGIDWDAHVIGWAIAGGCTIATVIISLVNVILHCRNYTNPVEQRQILRILYMPPVYAIISFFSYRFFRAYTYYSLVEVAYEAVTISAFLLLLIEYVASTATGHKAENAIARKDKRPLPIPFCCWRYRPTKGYFMYTVKWSVLQYVIVRPAVSIAAMICEKYDVLCESAGYSPRWASVYLEAIDFVSISVALYGLFVFYGLTKDELVGRRPLAKFLCIKLIVMATFYQSFIFSALKGRVIKPTKYWTATNISDGLNALAICIEMVFFALGMLFAYRPSEYKKPGASTTSIWRPLWDSINYSDFAVEIWGSLQYFFCSRRLASTSSATMVASRPSLGSVFGVERRSYKSTAGQSNGSESAIGLRHYQQSPDGIRLGSYPTGAGNNDIHQQQRPLKQMSMDSESTPRATFESAR